MSCVTVPTGPNPRKRLVKTALRGLDFKPQYSMDPSADNLRTVLLKMTNHVPHPSNDQKMSLTTCFGCDLTMVLDGVQFLESWGSGDPGWMRTVRIKCGLRNPMLNRLYIGDQRLKAYCLKDFHTKGHYWAQGLENHVPRPTPHE